MMERTNEHQPGQWVASLRAFLGTQPAAVARCELCNTEIEREHDHLIEPESRHLLCACPPCALLFASTETKRYRRVPRRIVRLPDFELSGAQWDAFLIPINMAFFFHSSPEGRVLALYPGPAGATESTLDLGAWEVLAAANPVLEKLEPDVEALLVNRLEGAREYYRVPIDRCYELVGRIRRHWHGLSGGDEVRKTIRTFFKKLDEETTPAHA